MGGTQPPLFRTSRPGRPAGEHRAVADRQLAGAGHADRRQPAALTWGKKHAYETKSLVRSDVQVAAWVFTGCAGRGGDRRAAPRAAGARAASGENAGSKSTVAEVPGEPGEKAAAPAGRQWKDPAGKTLATGQFVSLLEGKVCLETSDGLGAVVPLDALCEADRDFARQQGGASAVVEEPLTEVIKTAGETAGEMAAALPAVRADSSGREKVVIPFDFVSEFDNGRYGGMIGEMIVAKIRKEGRLATPMRSRSRHLRENQIKITPQTPIEEIGRVLATVRRADRDLGELRKGAGQEWDVSDLTINAPTFPRVRSRRSSMRKRTSHANGHEIPHLYVKEMLDALHAARLASRRRRMPLPSRIGEQPDLVEGGDFEKALVGPRWAGKTAAARRRGGGGGAPSAGRAVDCRVRQSGQPGDPLHLRPGRRRWIRGDVLQQTLPDRRGAKYRFQCRYRSTGRR